MKLTPLKQRIVDALEAEPTRQMHYYALAYKLWAPEQHPKAWNYSNNGGPHGWAMPLGRALRELKEAKLVYETPPRGGGAGHGDVFLRMHNAKLTGEEAPPKNTEACRRPVDGPVRERGRDDV